MSRKQPDSVRRLVALALLLIAGRAAGQGDATIDVEIVSPKPVLFVHEPFELEIVVRSSGVRLGQSFRLQGFPPDEELRRGDFGEMPAQDALRGNVLQSTRRFRCVTMAMKTGDLQIAPSLELSILTRQMGFFGPSWVEQRRQVAARPITLSVKPLPSAGRPAGYSGAVGNFTLAVAVSPSELAVGDLVKISTAVRGQGYLDGIVAPALPALESFKLYPAVERVSSVPTERLFEQTLIPLSTNARVIPALSFSFFDPAQGQYGTLSQGPFALTFHARTDPTFVPYRPVAPTGAKPETAATQPASERPARDAGRIVLVTSYWVVAGGLTLLVYRRGRKFRFLALLVPAIALAGFRPVLTVALRGRAGVEERFIRDVTVRFAPSMQSAGQWQAPSGTVASVTESWGGWRQVEVDRDAGWVPADALAP
jgi:hypothetical protein